MFYIILNAFVIINILPLVDGVTVDYHKKKNVTRDEVEGGIFSEIMLFSVFESLTTSF
jgi:hypothetical protein